MMWNAEWLWSQCSGSGLHPELIWGSLNYFAIQQRHHCPSRFERVFLGTRWSSIKQIKAPYIFDLEYGIALHAMNGNQASSRGEWEISWFFSSCGGNLWVYSRVLSGRSFKTRVCTVNSGLMSRYEGHLMNLPEAWHWNRAASRGETGGRGSLSSCHFDIGIPIHFQKESGIVTF